MRTLSNVPKTDLAVSAVLLAVATFAWAGFLFGWIPLLPIPRMPMWSALLFTLAFVAFLVMSVRAANHGDWGATVEELESAAVEAKEDAVAAAGYVKDAGRTMDEEFQYLRDRIKAMTKKDG